MKEYKMITVKMEYKEDKTKTATSSSITESMKKLFFPNEFENDHIVTEKVEKLMQEMNQDGWEVVSVTPLSPYPPGIILLITFEREM